MSISLASRPGAGGSSDTVGLLAALVRNGARGAVLAILDDAAATVLLQSFLDAAAYSAEAPPDG